MKQKETREQGTRQLRGRMRGTGRHKGKSVMQRDKGQRGSVRKGPEVVRTAS